jgi:hypothetical protein
MLSNIWQEYYRDFITEYRIREIASRHLEEYAAAFLKETDILASECELVIKNTGNEIIFEFRRKHIAS